MFGRLGGWRFHAPRASLHFLVEAVRIALGHSVVTQIAHFPTRVAKVLKPEPVVQSTTRLVQQ